MHYSAGSPMIANRGGDRNESCDWWSINMTTRNTLDKVSDRIIIVEWLLNEVQITV
jgi:hypothetical protein